MKKLFRSVTLCAMISATAGMSAVPVPMLKNPGTVETTVTPKVGLMAPGAAIQIQPEPYIQSFGLRTIGAPSNRIEILQGQHSSAYFVWNVSAGTPPSPITQMRISRTLGSGPNVNTTLTSSGGSSALTIPSETPLGETVYTLTAVNEAGNVKSVSATLKVLSLSEFASQFSGMSADMDHSAENTNFDLRLGFNNATTIPNLPVKVSVYVGHGMAKKATLRENHSMFIYPGMVQTTISNLKIPSPASGESTFTTLTVDVKKEDGTLIRTFQRPLQSQVVRTYWVPGT